MGAHHQTESLLTGEKGGATAIALVTVSVTLILALTCLTLAQADLRMTTRNIQSRQAMYLAESGIELSRAELAKNPAWCPLTRYSLQGGSYTINLSQISNGFTITSEGKYGVAVRKLQATIELTGTGAWKITSYKEIYS